MICEATTDEDVNETEDVVYEELDNLPNGDAARVPKGVSYVLDEGYLCVPIELNGTITAMATVYSDLPDQALEFKYNVDGLRTQKKLTKPDKSTVTTDYILHGDQVNHVTITEADASGNVTATNNLHFYYDAANRPIALDFNGAKYFYAHNVHNDIAAILDSNGSIVVEYKYNAWGELLATTGTYATTLGKLNPFRYRGYVYDEESGLYYLRNRYYNPELQRFISADCNLGVLGNILSANVFAYCYNNPTYYVDHTGNVPQAVTDATIHRKVLENICSQNINLTYHNTCIYYNGINFRGGWGFCDLYNPSTGEVWELKKQSNSRSCRTSNAQKQLDKYINGRLKANPSLILKKPYTTVISSGNFSLTLDGYHYSIDYWSEGNGILRYRYTPKKTDFRKSVEQLATSVVGLAASVLVGFATGNFGNVRVPQIY